MTRFYERGYIAPSLSVVECAECGALVVRDNEGAAEGAHESFHTTVSRTVGLVERMPAP